jgi:hypothetical protein
VARWLGVSGTLGLWDSGTLGRTLVSGSLGPAGRVGVARIYLPAQTTIMIITIIIIIITSTCCARTDIDETQGQA